MNLNNSPLEHLEKIALTLRSLAEAQEKAQLEAQLKELDTQCQTQTAELTRLETEIQSFETLLERVQDSQLLKTC